MCRNETSSELSPNSKLRVQPSSISRAIDETKYKNPKHLRTTLHAARQPWKAASYADNYEITANQTEI